MSEETATPPGFSRVVRRDDVPVAGLDLKLEADDAARVVLAARLGLLSLDLLFTRVEVFPWRRTGLRLEGSFSAAVVQACVVSLEPVPAVHEETFVLRYRPMLPAGEDEREVSINPLEDEPPEHLPDEGIDLGEVVAEQLVLALAPYPKAVAHGEIAGGRGGEDPTSSDLSEKKANPFEVLRNFKPNDDG